MLLNFYTSFFFLISADRIKQVKKYSILLMETSIIKKVKLFTYSLTFVPVNVDIKNIAANSSAVENMSKIIE